MPLIFRSVLCVRAVKLPAVRYFKATGPSPKPKWCASIPDEQNQAEKPPFSWLWPPWAPASSSTHPQSWWRSAPLEDLGIAPKSRQSQEGCPGNNNKANCCPGTPLEVVGGHTGGGVSQASSVYCLFVNHSPLFRHFLYLLICLECSEIPLLF